MKQPPSVILHVGKGFLRASDAKQGQVTSLGPAYRRDESCPVGNLEMHARRGKFMRTFRLSRRQITGRLECERKLNADEMGEKRLP